MLHSGQPGRILGGTHHPETSLEAPPRRSVLQALADWTVGRAAPSANGNGHRPAVALEAVKSSGLSGVTLIPPVDFVSPDSTATIFNIINSGRGLSEADRVTAETSYCAAVYAYCAMRWRAARLSEAPLMVVNEDRTTGNPKWLPNHPLADLLDAPSVDYDMGELLFRTSVAVDKGGQALWVIDANGLGAPGRLSLFRAHEFTVESAADRIRGRFRVSTTRGSRTFAPDEVVYFHEVDPDNWLKGFPRVEVFLSYLNLAQDARATVRDLLANAVWPSLAVNADKEWQPSDGDWERYKEELNSYGMRGQKGRAMAFLGGGTANVLSTPIKDLVPEDIFNRVESIAAAAFGVPAIILQFMVGMENSPWSQMEQARRMAYEDTVEPMWRDYEKVLTRQLLRPLDENKRHLIRFDTSKVKALQTDLGKQALIVVQLAKVATLNERRTMVGLEPSDDPAADEIPELQPPPPLPGLFDPGAATAGDAAKRVRLALEAKRDVWATLRADEAARAQFGWQLVASKQLELDRDHVHALALEHLAGEKEDEDVPAPAAVRRFRVAVGQYLEGPARKRWADAVGPQVAKDARRATTPVVADLGISFNVVRPALADYAKREAGFLVRSVTATTRDAIGDAVADGLNRGLGAKALAQLLKGLPAFNADRALLVARTEATRVTQGAPTEALQQRQAETGQRYTKTWRGALDDRERDEHVAMEGETVGVDEEFSNGLQFPSEPNCRCVVTYAEAPAE